MCPQTTISPVLKIFMTNNGFRYDLILAGILISYFNLNLRPRKSLVYISLALLIYYPTLKGQAGYDTVFYFCLVAVLCAIVIMAKANNDLFFTEIPILPRVMDYLGKRSYIIYVLHFQVLALLGFLLQRKGVNYSHPFIYNLSVTFGSIPFLVVIELLHQYVEMPAIAFGKAITSGKNR